MRRSRIDKTTGGEGKRDSNQELETSESKGLTVIVSLVELKRSSHTMETDTAVNEIRQTKREGSLPQTKKIIKR